MMALATVHPLYTIREESLVQFYPLFLRAPENDRQDWRVGVDNSAIAIELPVEGIRAIQLLQTGTSIAETAAILQQELDEAIDLVDLVQGLAEVGLVASLDEYHFALPEVIEQAWLQRIPPAAVGWLYSPVTLVICAVLILLGPLLLVFQPALRPHAQDLLWSPSYSLDLLLLLVIGPLLIFKHESGHLLAARAKGLSAELTFGHRFLYLVAVSRIGGIWKCSRFERLLIYSAGMASDCMTASLCTLLLFAASHGILSLPSPLLALLRFITLSEYLGVAWQFQIFFKTDVYYIFADLTGRHDLPEQASALLHSWWYALFPRAHSAEQQDQPVRYDTLMLGYTALSIVGIGASCIWCVWYALPATLLALHGEYAQLMVSIPTKNIGGLCDSLAALGIQLLCFSLLGWSIARTYLKRSSR